MLNLLKSVKRSHMSKEHFKILKEASSLEQTIKELESKNKLGQERVNKLLEQQNEALSTVKELTAKFQEKRLESQKNENELTSIDSKLTKIKSDIGASFDAKEMEMLDKEKQKLLEKVDQLEMAGLELLENLEAIEGDIQDKNTFLEGIKETISEIQSEVDIEAGERSRQIDSLQTRITASLEELPESFVLTYNKVKAKNLSVSMFTKIQAKSCSVCKAGVDRSKEVQVEEQLLLKLCSSCGRIFIPNQALY